MSKHTPGPWTAEPEEAIRVRAPDGGAVAILGWLRGRDGLSGRRPADEVLANARLIAAAPELLEIVQMILGEGGNPMSSLAGVEKRARALLRRIEGEHHP